MREWNITSELQGGPDDVEPGEPMDVDPAAPQ
jgi:hypothetical protein